MRRLLIFASFLIFLFSSISQAEGNVFESVVKQIEPRLKIIKGKVIGVKGKSVILNKGSNQGMFKNYFVYIYRNMGSFIPLNSNKPVELKEGIAFATVKKVSENKSVAVITQGIERIKKYFLGLGIIPTGEKEVLGTPRVGDNWIAGKSTYRIAIITRNPYIYSQLKSAFDKTGRFFVISPDTIQIALVKHRINTLYEKKAIKQLANILDADLILLVSTIKHQKLKYRLINGYSGRAIAINTLPISKKTQLVLNQHTGANIPPTNLVASNLRLRPKLTFWETILSRFGLYSPYTNLDMSSPSYKVVLYKNIGYGTTAFFSGKVDNKNGNIVLVAQGSKVKAYRFDIDSFDKLFSFSYGYNIINIDSAKIDGKYMIAISNFNRYGQLSSCIGYIKDNKFHIIKDNIPYHIKFLDRYSKNPILIAQKASVAEPFYGSIYKLDIKTMKISKLSLPISADSLYDIYQTQNDIVFVNRSKNLVIYNTTEGKIVYRSPYIFGGGERPIERYPQPVNMTTRSLGVQTPYDKYRTVYIPKSIKLIKTKNGFEILAIRNYLSHNITINTPHYQGYNIKLFKLKDNKVKMIWTSGDVKGRIVGFGKDGDYIISVIGLPASFFYRFIEGILEVDRLTAARMEY